MFNSAADVRERESIHLHVSSPPSEAQQLLVLAGDEVDGGVLQQGGEHEEQTDGHPDIDGFYVGHLQEGRERVGPRIIRTHGEADVWLVSCGLVQV